MGMYRLNRTGNRRAWFFEGEHEELPRLEDIKEKEQPTNSKCNKCYANFNWQDQEMKVEEDGHDLIVTLYCPKCHKRFSAYDPNFLIANISRIYVENLLRNPRHGHFDWKE